MPAAKWSSWAPAATDPVDQTLVLASPSLPVTTRETARIVAWVAAGGRLVIVGGPPPAGAAAPYESAVVGAFGLSDYAYHRREIERRIERVKELVRA